MKTLVKTRPDTTGMHSYIFHSHGSVPVECFFDYQPLERQTHWEPEVYEELTIAHAFVGNEDILELMSDQIIGYIETVAFAKLQKDRKDDADDYRIDRAIDNRSYESFASFLG